VRLIKYLFGTREPGRRFDGQAGSIVILGQERFGDLIVLTPLIRKLRQAFPAAEIFLLGVTRMITFLSEDKNLNHVLNIKRTNRKYRKEILSRQFDLLFNTKDHPSFTFLFLTARLSARYKIGIYHSVHLGYFDHMEYLNDDLPAVEKNMALVRFLNVPYGKSDLKPYLPEDTPDTEIVEFISGLSEENIIGINLSASNPGKEWPIACWDELLSMVKHPVIIFAMPDDAEKKAALEKKHANVYHSPPTRTLLNAGHLIRRIKVLITPDTALVHVAGCYNIPVVVLYRLERDMKKFPPLSDRFRTLISPTSNLSEIKPETVAALVNDLLDIN
jgi:heptosyltransferase-3